MPGMDIESASCTLDVQRSPPIQIASPRIPAAPEGPSEDVEIFPKLDHEAIKEKAKRRRKHKKKAQGAAPALNVIRGFQTPVASGGEESDISMFNSPRMGATRLLDFPSASASPAMRPTVLGAGVSALSAQLDALELEGAVARPRLARTITNASRNQSTAPPSSRGSDGDRTEMETYDVPLDEDFISPDAGSRTPLLTQAIDGGLRNNSVHRKMSADDFEPVRCLGKGAFGTVHLVKQSATGKLYAQKQFKKASLTVHKRLIEQTRTERTILESVNRHPFVVKLYYAFQDHEKLYLILEYAQGGELFHHLAIERMFTEEVAAFYMAEMILALEHLHQNVRVIYRDLKPENCLLDVEGHLLLTDFGLSKVALDSEDERTNSVLGTIEYMAPEVIEGKPYDFSVDWWGLGAIGYDLLTGSPPFGGNNHAKIQHNILTQKLKLPYFLGPDAKDLLTRLLRKEPQKRLGGTTSKDIKVLKAHRFFRKIDWKKLETRELEPVSVLPMYLLTRLPADLEFLANSARHHGSCASRELQQGFHRPAIESRRCSRW
jgi:serine/threonine protein kinase